MQVAKQRRQYGIARIGFADILLVMASIRILRSNAPGESIQGKQLLRIGRPAEVREHGEKAESARQWQPKLLELDCDFGRSKFLLPTCQIFRCCPADMS